MRCAVLRRCGTCCPHRASFQPESEDVEQRGNSHETLPGKLHRQESFLEEACGLYLAWMNPVPRQNLPVNYCCKPLKHVLLSVPRLWLSRRIFLRRVFCRTGRGLRHLSCISGGPCLLLPGSLQGGLPGGSRSQLSLGRGSPSGKAGWEVGLCDTACCLGPERRCLMVG